MLTLIIGQPNSGKSEFAESLVSSCAGPTAYIGTLPHLGIFSKRIQRHQLRRPSSWDLLELVGNPNVDTHSIAGALDRYQNILLDGLAFYVLQVFTLFSFQPSEFEKHTRELARDFSKYRGEIVIVDQPIAGIKCDKTAAALQRLHITLARESDKIQLISEKQVTTIQAHELVELDRLRDGAI